MTGFFTSVNRRFNAGSIAAKYIYINVGVFILVWLLIFLFRLFMKEGAVLTYLEMPSSPALLLQRPWTIITYMFVHVDFLHILFNMLWLYWFGNIFLQFFTGRQLGGLYLSGGIAGGLLFMLAYNIFPYLKQLPQKGLIGASASIMAIVFAVALYRREYRINLLIFGRVKLIYLALGVLLVNLLAVTSESNGLDVDRNYGGFVAHVGGALLGALFAVYRSGRPFIRFSRPDSPPRHRPESDDAYLRRKNEDNRTIDGILDKLKHSGYESLSANEKKKLFEASSK